MKKTCFLTVIIFVILILTACSSPESIPDYSLDEYTIFKNPEDTLQVPILASDVFLNWKQLESDLDNSIRLSYEPSHDETKQVIIRFNHSAIDIFSDRYDYYGLSVEYFKQFLDNYINGGFTWVPHGILAKEITIKNRSALQHDTTFIQPESDQEMHLSVILVEGEKHYLVITIFCQKENYTEDRTSPLWRVIESVEELDV